MSAVERATVGLVGLNAVLFLALWATLPWTFSASLLKDAPTYMSMIALYLLGNLSASLAEAPRLLRSQIAQPTVTLAHTALTTVLLLAVLGFAARATFATAV